MRVSKKQSENVFEEMNRRIDEIYGRRDLALYRQLISSTSQSLDPEIAEFCRAREIEITDRNLDSDFSEKPYNEWRFDFPPFQKPGYYIEYATTLQISKLCRLFFLRNSFKMKDMNPDATNDYLEGEGHATEPITNAQKELYDKIVGRLTSGAYRRLNKRSEADVDVAGLAFSPKSPLYEPQYPILATYYDVFFRCEYDELVCLEYYYELRK